MDLVQRRLLGLGMATGLAMAAGRAGAAQPEATEGARREPQDEWLDQGGHRHRMVFDTLSSAGLGLGMNFVNNFFNANKAGYGIAAAELSVVVVLRHTSTPFGFTDAMWAKYGDQLGSYAALTDPRSKAAPRVNLFRVAVDAPGLPNGATTLEGLTTLGTRFAVCAVAASKLAEAIAAPSHGDAKAVLAELEANLIPNARMVPAGITAVNRAQEHGYTFSYCG